MVARNRPWMGGGGWAANRRLMVSLQARRCLQANTLRDYVTSNGWRSDPTAVSRARRESATSSSTSSKLTTASSTHSPPASSPNSTAGRTTRKRSSWLSEFRRRIYRGGRRGSPRKDMNSNQEISFSSLRNSAHSAVLSLAHRVVSDDNAYCLVVMEEN